MSKMRKGNYFSLLREYEALLPAKQSGFHHVSQEQLECVKEQLTKELEKMLRICGEKILLAYHKGNVSRILFFHEKKEIDLSLLRAIEAEQSIEKIDFSKGYIRTPIFMI